MVSSSKQEQSANLKKWTLIPSNVRSPDNPAPDAPIPISDAPVPVPAPAQYTKEDL